MMDPENSKSTENSKSNSAIRKFPDHPPIVNEDGLVIDCVLEDYPDPPKGTVETILDEYGDLIDCVDVHERSLQRGYDIPLKPHSFPSGPKILNPSFPYGISAGVPKKRPCPEGTLPVIRLRKNYKPPDIPKSPLPPFVHRPELSYSPVDVRSDKMMPTLKKDMDATSDVNPEVKKCLAVIQSMVDDGLIEDCSPIWCYAVSLNKSVNSRSILMNLSTNLKRHAWLKWEFAQNKA